jgi:transposase
VDGLGTPLAFVLTGGEVSDITQAETLLNGWQATHVIADKGYDANALVAAIEQRGAIAVIPSRSNRKHPRELDAHLYKERHLIECWFNKLKHFRRVFSRFEKTAKNFLSFVYFTALLIEFR